MAARKAASVLPEPVGAAISTCRPAWKAGQACACAAVGAAKLRSNHAATAGGKKEVGVMGPDVGRQDRRRPRRGRARDMSWRPWDQSGYAASSPLAPSLTPAKAD